MPQAMGNVLLHVGGLQGAELTLKRHLIAGVTLGHVTPEVGGVAGLQGTLGDGAAERLGVLVAQLVSAHRVVVARLPATQGAAVWTLPGVLPHVYRQGILVSGSVRAVRTRMGLHLQVDQSVVLLKRFPVPEPLLALLAERFVGPGRHVLGVGDVRALVVQELRRLLEPLATGRTNVLPDVGVYLLVDEEALLGARLVGVADPAAQEVMSSA